MGAIDYLHSFTPAAVHPFAAGPGWWTSKDLVKPGFLTPTVKFARDIKYQWGHAFNKKHTCTLMHMKEDLFKPSIILMQ